MSQGICITVDLEREFMKNDLEFRRKTVQILDLFQNFGIKGTFFVCGDIVERDRKFLHWIATEHEVAAHGFHHRNLRQLNEKKLAAEIRRTRDAFTNTGIPCIGFRCPFLIVPRCLGPILKENSFLYDSSLQLSPFSLHSLLYPFSRIKVEGVQEIPIQVVTPVRIPFNLSSLRLFGLRHLPRLLPEEPQMFYFHPWELVEKEDLRGHPFRRRMLVNTGGKAVKILEFLFAFMKGSGRKFLTCGEWIQSKAAETDLYPGHTG